MTNHSTDDHCDPYALLAAWVLPVDQPPIRDGAVVVDRGTNRILAVGPRETLALADNWPQQQFDQGDATLIPGFVNAHTHLEFSDLSEPLGRAGIAFTDWIEAIIDCRRDAGTGSPAKRSRVQAGIEESFRHGVWAVGDIATLPTSADDYLFSDGQSVSQDFHRSVFLEQLGRDVSKLPELQSAATSFAESFDAACGERLQPAFSPHAPYSTHPRLTQQLSDLAKQHNTGVAMHLAETSAERELIQHRSGPFVTLLKKLGVWSPTSFEPTVSILNLLQILAVAPRSLVVHGNYLTTSEIDFIADHRDRMSVAFCPRTHRYFNHDTYPLPQLLVQSINVAVGTDSRASNPDLSILAELRLIQESFDGVAPDKILAMGTINGAIALGIDHDYGSLTAGKLAAINVLADDGSLNAVSPWNWLDDNRVTCQPLVT